MDNIISDLMRFITQYCRLESRYIGLSGLPLAQTLMFRDANEGGMKNMKSIALILALLIWQAAPAFALEVTGKAIVVDGDTIDIDQTRIRHTGIDAPEAGQKCKKLNGGILHSFYQLLKWQPKKDDTDPFTSAIKEFDLRKFDMSVDITEIAKFVEKHPPILLSPE